jgi:hypothetical protein
LPSTNGAAVRQPSICIMGGNDPVFPAVKAAYDKLETHMTDLRKKVMLPGVGHSRRHAVGVVPTRRRNTRLK